MAKTNFTDGDPSQGILGTIVSAAFLNGLGSHRHDGLDADGSGPIDYAVDSGAANAYVLTFSPAFTAYITGLPIVFKAANANTGASTLAINGMEAKAVKKNVSDALAANDIKAGQVVTVVFDGTNFQLVSRMEPNKESAVKGWINFNGTGTIAINDHYNVSSITDNGTGDYTITWDTDFANANYAVAGFCRDNNTPGNSFVTQPTGGIYTAGQIQIVAMKSGGGYFDSAVVTLIAIGDQ